MFRTVPLSFVWSFFTVHTAMVYVIQVCRQLANRIRKELQFRPDPVRKLSAKLYDIPLLCAQWKTPDDWQRNCPKHLEFYSKNKFEKLVHLVGFITSIYCGDYSRWLVTWRQTHNKLSNRIWAFQVHHTQSNSCTLLCARYVDCSGRHIQQPPLVIAAQFGVLQVWQLSLLPYNFEINQRYRN